MKISFEDYLKEVIKRNNEGFEDGHIIKFEYTEEQIIEYTYYFEECYDYGLSPYKALTFFMTKLKDLKSNMVEDNQNIEEWILDYISKNPLISYSILYYKVQKEFKISIIKYKDVIDKLVSKDLIVRTPETWKYTTCLKISKQKLREDKLNKILK